jgi:hypothetical protein
MMLRTSDYQPVKLPLTEMARLGFNHWRTEWRAPEADEEPSGVIGLLGCGTSIWEICAPETWAWITWDWAVLDGGLITLTNSVDIRSNVILLGEGDRHLPMHDSSAILMSVIHDLPWREEVEKFVSNRSGVIH